MQYIYIYINVMYYELSFFESLLLFKRECDE